MATKVEQANKLKAIRKELAILTKQGGGILRPEAVVEFARDESTALHSQFDWEDTEAADKWRLHQARNLIRVQVTFEPRVDREIQCYVSLPSDREDEGGGYRRMVDVLSNADRRQQLLEMALAELNAFKRKYRELNELAGVFEAIKTVGRKIA